MAVTASAALARLWPFILRGRGHRPKVLVSGSAVLFEGVGAVMSQNLARARSRDARQPGHRQKSVAVLGTTWRRQRVATGEPRAVWPAA